MYPPTHKLITSAKQLQATVLFIIYTGISPDRSPTKTFKEFIPQTENLKI